MGDAASDATMGGGSGGWSEPNVFATRADATFTHRFFEFASSNGWLAIVCIVIALVAVSYLSSARESFEKRQSYRRATNPDRVREYLMRSGGELLRKGKRS